MLRTYYIIFLIICFRCVHKSKIVERFVGFVELDELNTEALSNVIRTFIEKLGLDITNCISQAYDGASVMSGRVDGVQVKIWEASKHPCPYVHCYTHKLNLVLVDVAKTVEKIGEIIGFFEEIYAF